MTGQAKRDFSKGRPKQVAYAVYLMYISTGWAILTQLVLSPPAAESTDEVYLSLVCGFGSIVLAVLIVVALGRAIMGGSNRARIFTIILYLLGLGYTLLYTRAWLDYAAMHPVQTALRWAGTIIQLVAIVLLLLPVSNQWFRSVKAEKQAL